MVSWHRTTLQTSLSKKLSFNTAHQQKVTNKYLVNINLNSLKEAQASVFLMILTGASNLCKSKTESLLCFWLSLLTTQKPWLSYYTARLFRSIVVGFWDVQDLHKSISRTEMFTSGFIASRLIFASARADKLSSRQRLSHKNLDKYQIILFGFKCFNTWKLSSLQKNSEQ